MASLLEHLEAAGERCTPGIRAAFLALEQRVAELEALVRAQSAEIQELKRRLKQHSQNSSLPPSSDPPHLKAARRKERSRRPRGGQPGHERRERALLPPERVDHRVDHHPEHCGHCGRFFLLQQPAGAALVCQVIELPVLRAEVTEHRLHRFLCYRCGESTRAAAPAGLQPGVVFGPRLVALSAMLTVRLRASRRNLQQVLGDLLDVEPPSLGQLQALLEEASAACRSGYHQVCSRMRRSAVLHVDETGWRLRGQGYWLWTAANAHLSCYRLAPQRSGWARQRLLGRHFAGRIISDRLGAYNDLPPPRRQLCWAHLIRDFRSWQEHPPAVQLARSCEQQAEALFAEWHRFRAGRLSRAELQQALTPIQQRLRLELERGTVSGVSRVERSCKQLLRLWDALWSFAEHDEVEPTNNEAERAPDRGDLAQDELRQSERQGAASGRASADDCRDLPQAEAGPARLPHGHPHCTAHRPALPDADSCSVNGYNSTAQPVGEGDEPAGMIS